MDSMSRLCCAVAAQPGLLQRCPKMRLSQNIFCFCLFLQQFLLVKEGRICYKDILLFI
jgi:hypothetical protein